MKKIIQAACGMISAGMVLLLAATIYVQYSLPAQVSMRQDEPFIINSRMSITASAPADEKLQKNMFGPAVYDNDGNRYHLRLHLFGQTPVKEISVQTEDRKMVVPGGIPFGIKMFTEGVMIVGMSDIQTGTENHNPAKEAGLKVGDIIIQIDNEPVTGNNDVARLISESNGDEVQITIFRNDNLMELNLQPIQSEFDQGYKAGIWVRDSSAGIGTMTYYDPYTLDFAGLGHAICDVDTGDIMPLSSGEIVDVNISGVHAGQSGKPGELKGVFGSSAPMGNLLMNSDCGIFGTLSEPLLAEEAVPMAYKHEIQPGPATILATISGNKPQSFDIMIEKVNYSDINPTKNMVIRVVDEKLLAATGGIVQGMSGSPIIQDGKLAGAVTHVFVNDPTRGYGIFAENMENEFNHVEIGQKSA